MSIVYHYTTQQAAYSIVKNESLRFTNIHFLNDQSEWRWFFDCACELHQKAPIEWVARELARRDAHAKYLAEIGYEGAHDETAGMASIFISCFTSAVDDASQWDRYADKGGGICLGFDKDHLEEWIKADKKFSSGTNSFADWINYDRDTTNRIIKSSQEDPVFIAAFHKSESYKSEEEYRLCHWGVAYWHYEFMPRDDNLKCFIESSIPNFRAALKEVWLGPRSRAEAFFAWDVLLSAKNKGNFLPFHSLKRSQSKFRG